MGGVYLATYTAKYPASADALPETGYLAPAVRAAVAGLAAARRAQVLSNYWADSNRGDELWERVGSSYEPLSFVKRSGVWTAHRGTPPTGDRVILGGYAEPVTLTELNELLAAGLITSEDRDAAIAASQA